MYNRVDTPRYACVGDLNNYFKKYNINLNVPMERRELTPVEIIASGFERLSISPYVKLSMVNEAGTLNALA